MKIVYTCPKCGKDLGYTMIATNPSTARYECECGWCYEEPPVEIARVPFPYTNWDNNDPCRFCSNNPRNGGTGICHCIIGSHKITC